jgi:hypothetical protein
VVKQITGMRIAAGSQCLLIEIRGIDVQPIKIQVSIERQIPTAAKPTMKSVADTRKPLSGQSLTQCPQRKLT